MLTHITREQTRLALQRFAEGDPPPDEGTGAGGKGGSKGGGFSTEYVEQLRSESASWRTKYREAETKLGTITGERDTLLAALRETSGVADGDAAKALAALKTKLDGASQTEARAQEALRRAAFVSAAGNLHNPDDAYRIAELAKATRVDLETGKVTFVDDKGATRAKADGQPYGMADFMADLAKDKPYLVKTTTPGAVGTGGTPPGATGGQGKVDFSTMPKADFEAYTRRVMQGEKITP